MSNTISIDDFPVNVRERLQRVAEGETIVVVDNDRPVAEIRPVPATGTQRTLLEILESLPHLTPEEAEAFGRDINDARAEADRIPLRDPWES